MQTCTLRACMRQQKSRGREMPSPRENMRQLLGPERHIILPAAHVLLLLDSMIDYICGRHCVGLGGSGGKNSMIPAGS